MPRQNVPGVLVGYENSDDAGVFQLTPDVFLVQTVDYFSPIVDDAYTYGQIAAANSLSDVYAIRQGFSACVGWINSRSSFAPGTGWTMSKMSHLSFIFALSLTLTTYISCSSW